MNKDVILGIVRHVLTGVGGYFIAKGAIDAAAVELLVGSVITIAGVIWSILDKKPATPPTS
jgi:hypothetical protein